MYMSWLSFMHMLFLFITFRSKKCLAHVLAKEWNALRVAQGLSYLEGRHEKTLQEGRLTGSNRLTWWQNHKDPSVPLLDSRCWWPKYLALAFWWKYEPVDFNLINMFFGENGPVTISGWFLFVPALFHTAFPKLRRPKLECRMMRWEFVAELQVVGFQLQIGGFQAVPRTNSSPLGSWTDFLLKCCETVKTRQFWDKQVTLHYQSLQNVLKTTFWNGVTSRWALVRQTQL